MAKRILPRSLPLVVIAFVVAFSLLWANLPVEPGLAPAVEDAGATSGKTGRTDEAAPEDIPPGDASGPVQNIAFLTYASAGKTSKAAAKASSPQRLTTKPLREDVDYGIEPDQAEPGGELAGETVSLLCANAIDAARDIDLPSPNRMGLSFARVYNSRSEVAGILGYGWTHTYGATLTPPEGTDPYLKILDSTGRGRYFLSDGQDTYLGAFQERTRVSLLTSGNYVWNRLDGSRYKFSPAGRLLQITDAAGNVLSLDYDAQGRLIAVTDASTGRALTLTYTGGGRLLKITGPVTAAVSDGVWVTYAYNAAGNLSSATYGDNSGFTYEYADPADAHNLTGKRDKKTYLLAQWAYDGEDRCISSFSPRGRGAAVSYVGDTRADVTDAYGTVRSYTIGTAGGRKRVTQLTGLANAPYAKTNAVRWTYDDSMRLTAVQYPNGTVNLYQNFDTRGNPRTVIPASGDPAERTITYTYHGRTNAPLTRTEASVLGGGSKVTTWDYDDPADPEDDPLVSNEKPTTLLYRLIEQGYTKDASGTTAPYKYTTRFSYNDCGQVTSFNRPVPAISDSTYYHYTSGTLDLDRVTDPLVGSTLFSAFDAAGYPGQMTDVNGQVKSFTYDGRARLTGVANAADGSTVQVAYNTAGKVASRTDEDGVTRSYKYILPYGNLDRITDQQGDYIQHYYDDGGNLSRVKYQTAGDSSVTTRIESWNYQSPDCPGLLWKDTLADGTFTRYNYDAAGNATGVTDPNGNSTGYAYDALNRPVAVTQPGGAITRMQYDRHGNLASLTDAEGRQSLYAYDDMGRLVSRTLPDSGTTSYGYDAAGNLAWKTDANGATATFTYDAIYRPTGASYPAGGGQDAYSVSYTYDEGTNGKGRLTSVTDPSGTTTFAYDSRGRLKRKITTVSGVSFTLSRVLTPGGRVTGITYPGGRSVAYDRSSCPCLVDGVTTTYNSVTATLLSGLTYRPFGESSAMNMGNGGTVSNTFDLNGRLTAANPGATMERDFTYDANGHLLTVTAANTPWVNRTFAYDGLNRLTSATGPFGTFSYLYDDTGNRLSAVLGSRNETYGYFAGTNRLSEIDGTGQTLYAYDTDGNTTSLGSLSFAWNREGRLIRVESGATPVSQYLYNAFGQRVLKSAGGLTTLYLYDFDGNLISETDGSGAIVTEYLYRGRVRLAMADRATGAVYTFHNNELGTPELMTDSTNTVVWEGISKPFGETAVNSGSTVVNNFRFQGQYYDAETGLHYNGQRYYDPKTGRYLTPDPIGLAGGVNPYVYVGNDPVNSVDPDGENPLLLIPFIVGYLLLHNPDVANAPSSPCEVTYASNGTAGMMDDSLLLIGGIQAVSGAMIPPSAMPVGRLGSPMNVRPGTNLPTTINGRTYTGHALDQMQGRGLVPSVVEDAIATGVQSVGRRGATVYTTDQARVILNPNGSVKTVMPQ